MPPASSTQAASTLLQLPAELLSVILSRLDTRDLARFAATCRSLCRDAPALPAPRAIRPVETELRWRAESRGLDVGSSLPEGATSWVAYLLKRDRRYAQMRQAPLAVGPEHSVFMDIEGRLLTCGSEMDGSTPLLGHAVDPDASPNANMLRKIGPPTPVPAMQDRRIISVATSDRHCLALSAESVVYSWTNGNHGALGHADEGPRAVPSRIESLSRVESIAAGPYFTSAAVDEVGRLFTWGLADASHDGVTMSNGLGYAADSQTKSQLTPKRVDALSQDRVVGVALGGKGFTLAATDAGAVFSFGFSWADALGHRSSTSEVLPRRIEALAETGRRFVAVAAGDWHALALTEEGELYGWGGDRANGHGRYEQTPRRVAALLGERVKLMYAREDASCAVTEKRELFTWSSAGDYYHIGHDYYNLGHGVDKPQATPKRVDGVGWARVAAVALGEYRTLAADEDGVVWAFGKLPARLVDPNHGNANNFIVKAPTPVPTLRVRALKSP